MSEYLSWHAPPRRLPDAARRGLAVVLRSASAALGRLARRLEARRASVSSLRGAVEYHTEAGAPEGALYVDGRLVGWIEGVNRL